MLPCRGLSCLVDSRCPPACSTSTSSSSPCRSGTPHALLSGRARRAPSHHHTRRTTTTTTRSSSGGSDEQLSPEKQAILDRINRAKAYKQGGDSSSPAAAPPPPSIQAHTAPPPPPPSSQPDSAVPMSAFTGEPSPSAANPSAGAAQPQRSEQQLRQWREEQQRAQEERQKRFEAASRKDSADTPAASQTDIINIIQSARVGPGRGSATQASDALRGAFENDPLLEGVDVSKMKMSEISELKEARRRAQGAELIVADEAYRPTSKSDKGRIGAPSPPAQPQGSSEQQQQQTTAQPYKPKVSSWGLFPRPSNISEAYGGGRTIKPGEPYEDPKITEERVRQSREALARYKRKMGLEVNERVEAEAEGIYKQGMERFKTGNLEAALAKFDEASKMVQTRTRVGGNVTLQKALVLDSLGNRDEAQKLYKQVRGHAVTEVSRRAKQMMYGFEAATFMKADQFNYGIRKEEYEPYFRRIIDKNKIYVPTPEEREADKRGELVAMITAVVVIAFPFGLAAALAHSAGSL